MCKYEKKSTAEKIMEAAWNLFEKNGYEQTTIAQIIDASGTSRSSFYHHYHGKEELLFTLAYSYDSAYKEWADNITPDLHAVEKLKSFNRYVMEQLEDSRYRDLYPALYANQVTTSGKRHIINPDRVYFRVLNCVLKEGIIKGEIRSPLSYAELTSLIVNQHIGLSYAWVLNQGGFSLVQYSERIMEPFFESLRAV